jgi:hypothetical protein
MRLGGLEHTDRPRVFLLSTTHGAETHSLAAAIATMRIYRDEPVIEHLYLQGAKLREGIEAAARRHGVFDHFKLAGPPCCLAFTTLDTRNQQSQAFRSLFLQETIRRGVLMPSLVVSYTHDNEAIARTIEAVDGALAGRGLAVAVADECLLDRVVRHARVLERVRARLERHVRVVPVLGLGLLELGHPDADHEGQQPDTDVDEYRASVQEEHGEDAERFLELYPGETEEQVLDSLLQARTDKVMTRAMHRWTRLQTRSGASDAFLYFFSHVPPEEDLEKYGAYHGAEVPYAFDNLGADSDAAYTETDYRLRDQMSAYWVNFARTGDPNGPGLPAWHTVAREPEQVVVVQELRSRSQYDLE